MRHARQKRMGIAAEHGSAQIETQRAIAVREALKKPNSEETCAAGKKDAASACALPILRRVSQHVVQIVGGQRPHDPSINPCYTLPAATRILFYLQ